MFLHVSPWSHAVIPWIRCHDMNVFSGVGFAPGSDSAEIAAGNFGRANSSSGHQSAEYNENTTNTA